MELENHIALLYLSVIVMDFNSFIKVRQKPVYHNQLFQYTPGQVQNGRILYCSSVKIRNDVWHGRPMAHPLV